MRTIALLLAAFVAGAAPFSATLSDAAVLCAKPKKDGTFNSGVKVREACKASEVQLDPMDLGFCCTMPTSTTTTSSTTTTMFHGCGVLSIDDCELGECSGGLTCQATVIDGEAACRCVPG